ncbi:MAG: GAF and ANTAR domain-containing protein [Deltaproteobacteria bacterium]|nr:GAF and ANTAR domain-containing protein [Deltaproteobacteria bacterium]OQY17366.1 MAG: histidine kinase [Desulfobacterium sp. 4572_20]HDH86540.1 GAF domain-containing protein [Desulfobacteraceae bacterium]MBW2104792.1 GAF and ANTAR domain-containing protein [Deltaproteobacteria bacterium]MBW2332653.1 GAF and ANTAR domain-containing protein [Deltaproteobacteria bacterium]
MDKISEETYDKYIKALTEISKAITSDQYLEDILKLIVMVTAKVTGVDICSLWLIEEGEKDKKARLKATQAIDPDYVKDRVLTMNEGVVGYVASTNRPLIIEDVLQEPRFKEKEMAKKLGLVSMASVPMHVKEDKVIGVLNCFTTRPHIFSETELNLITAVANQAAVAIENTQLMVRTKIIEEELEKRKMIDRAKEILISKKGLSAEKAFRWIQKKSMDTRKSMKEIAEAIIISQDI